MRLLFSALLCLVVGGALTACGQTTSQPDISLYLAIERSDIEQIKKHINAGSDLNELNPDGLRPIHVTAQNGRDDILRLLLSSKRLDVDALDALGNTALYYALFDGRTRFADLLAKQGASIEANSLLLAISAAGTQHREGIMFLAEHGADLNNTNSSGDTPLIIAIRANNHRLVRHLVDSGADVNNRDRAGNSALAIANQAGLSDIALLLKRHGAN